jgi:hypothetical protein
LENGSPSEATNRIRMSPQKKTIFTVLECPQARQGGVTEQYE